MTMLPSCPIEADHKGALPLSCKDLGEGHRVLGKDAELKTATEEGICVDFIAY